MRKGGARAACVTACRKVMRKNASRAVRSCPARRRAPSPARHGPFWGPRTAGLRNSETLLLLCYPNCMCSSFTQNNPKQLQGNSAQCARQRAASGIQWQDDRQSFPAPKHPLWDYADNVLGFPRSSSPPPKHPHALATARFSPRALAKLMSFFQLGLANSYSGVFFVKVAFEGPRGCMRL